MTEQILSKDIRVNRDVIEMLLIAHQVSKGKVAEIAGLPRFTVSKVIHNRPGVPPEKRVAVLRAIAALTGRDPDALVMGRLAA